MWETTRPCLCGQKLTGIFMTASMTVYACRHCDRILVFNPQDGYLAWYTPEDISKFGMSDFAQGTTRGD